MMIELLVLFFQRALDLHQPEIIAIATSRKQLSLEITHKLSISG